MNSSFEKESGITLRQVFIILKRNWANILVWTIVGGVISLFISFFFINSKYQATSEILVNQKVNDNPDEQFSAQQADLQAIKTYKDVLTKSFILSPVLKEIKQKDNYEGSISDLKKSITINNESDSQILSISVTDTNPYRAADISNTVCKIFTKKIQYLMKVDNVRVVTKATPNVDPVSPNMVYNLLIGVTIGLLIGVFVPFVKKMLSTTLEDTSFTSNDLGLTDLGKIHHIEHIDDKLHAVHIINQGDYSDSNTRRV